MAWIDDIDILNDAETAGDWSITNYYDSPTLNNSSSTTPIYLEAAACMWWPLKKGGTNGYVGTDTISGTPSMTGRILVGLLNYPFADIDNIPITAIAMRMSSSTGFTTNYAQWDALAQLYSPKNVPISGHTPIMGYPDGGVETGTPNYGSVESVGWVATSGNNQDGKQGGFDWMFLVGWFGAHSVTLNGTYFSGLYSEYYDNEGNGLPGETSRPTGVLSKAGDFYQSNVNFQFGDGSADNANLVVTEIGKAIFFNNLHVNHELGYIFVDPNSTYENRITLIDCSHFWNDQSSSAEIFTDPENATYFKIDGCSFAKGGIFESPSDTANRWIRGCKFDSCQTGVISDGEFTNNIVSNCHAVTVSGDADLKGTQILTPVVAADAAGLIWNGNYDPDGNLDGMSFTKGTNAHHAIEFGTASPLTMTLRNIDVSGFNASNAQNDSVLHIKRTTGTVTINLVGCTGTFSYKSAGATVVVQATVDLILTVEDENGDAVQNAQASIHKDDPVKANRTQYMNEDTTALGVATESFSYPGSDVNIVWKVRKSATADDPRYFARSGTGVITSSGFSQSVTLKINSYV